jgi:prolyl-tRNA synthetase
MKGVYMKVFTRLGMGERTYVTISNGGSFSKYSYEFQTLSDAGEDVIYIFDEEKKLAINKDDFNDEIINDFDLKLDKDSLVGKKSIEVGDIYSLGYKYSEVFDLTYKNEEGQDELVYMGSFGMSPSRLMGTIVELNNDEKGIIWPLAVAPFELHLVALSKEPELAKKAEELYNGLIKAGFEVLYDDREESAGIKLKDSDLLGLPIRLVLSPKTLEQDSIEVKERGSDKVVMIKLDNLKEHLKSIIQ